MSEYLRSAIVDVIVENGGDYTCGLFVGNYSDVGRRFNVSEQTVKKHYGQQTLWDRGKLALETKRDLKILPIDRNWVGLNRILETKLSIDDYQEHSWCYRCYGFPVELQEARAVTSRMSCGHMSFKRISARPIVKFTPENDAYYQDYLDYMSSVDPYCIMCFDEAGFKLPDVAKPNYGHSVVGEQCIEVQRYTDTPNLALPVLAGLEGKLYANTVEWNDWYTWISNFFFFGEASKNFLANGEPWWTTSYLTTMQLIIITRDMLWDIGWVNTELK